MPSNTQKSGRFNLSSASILVVDGDQMQLTIMAQVLLGFGASSIAKFDNTWEAREAIEARAMNLVVLDPGTLGDDGYSLIPWLRRMKPPQRFVPVLVVTGFTPGPKISQFRDSGANLVVRKPFTPAIMHERIQWIIQDKRPYVECSGYAGPDRRFKETPLPDGQKGRRADDLAEEYLMHSQRALSQGEIDTIIKRGS
jgi:response regulator RpfG family c-di-GMP phosphodiesterase